MQRDTGTLKRILVPLDGTSQAEWAIPTAVTIARVAGARINLLNVEIPIALAAVGLRMVDRASVIERSRSMPEYLHAIGERITAAGVHTVGSSVCESAGATMSSLGEEIADHAAMTHADLVVMTTSSRSPIPQFFMGSVARDVVRASRAPVLMIKPKPEPVTELNGVHEFRHVLIPLDGSSFSEEVIDNAMKLGALGSARYTLLTVIDASRGSATHVEPDLLPVEQAALGEKARVAEARLERVAIRLRQRSLQVSTKTIIGGSAAEWITRVAHALNADLIAMTTHARRGVGTLVLGSVANQVIRAAAVPVLLHRPHGLK